MGFFSWMTQDTNESISNSFSTRGPLKCKMLDNKGNEWHENNYEGYGVFGGKDYFELLAEMNNMSSRDDGIEIRYEGIIEPDKIQWPNLVSEHYAGKWANIPPDDCPHQGYFYDDYPDDEEDY
jgi:hypothetical protein